MIGTVDLVIVGNASAARAATVSALQRGERVLVILRSADTRVARRLRRSLLDAAGADGNQLRFITNSEVVCVDGVNGVEAVVVRHAPTGCLSAVNAAAFVSSDVSSRREPNGVREQNSGDRAPSLLRTCLADIEE